MGIVERLGPDVRSGTRHPLDPLSADEIRAAVAIVRADREVASSVRFASVALKEPAKEAVLNGAHAEIEREAFVLLLDNAGGKTYEVVVSLTDEAVTSWTHVPEVQPPFLLDEYPGFERAIKEHPDYRAALERRGITDLDLVSIDPVPAGYWGREEDDGGRRICRGIIYVRARPGGNSHARHVNGLVALVDMNRMEVLDVADTGIVPLPPDPGEYAADHVGPLRDDVKPLEIVQPEGPSFEIDGWEVRWQKWRFRIGFNPREGLVLHLVTYEDEGRDRQVLYRASYSELAVTYADSTPAHWFMSFFDIGELQVGTFANALELGCDCLGVIRYFDAVVNDTRGEPVVLPNAVCLHEEDAGLLWKHVDMHTGKPEVRRSRRLVVSWITTLGNYEYGFYWYLYQDGSIESEVKLTGILQTGALAPGEEPQYGAVIAPQVNGIHHQHLFNVRLDLDVDGRENSVYEVHSEPVPSGPDNLYGTAFLTKETLLGTELEAQRTVDPLSGRSWKVVNRAVENGLGQPVGYKLVPGDNVLPMSQPGSFYDKRAAFARNHLWVTPYDERQLHPAGDYVYQSRGDSGLPAWTAGNRSVDGADVVVWYTFGHHHITRPEDWPVMPVARIGFALKPVGFFDRNPALDVPPPSHNGHACH